MGRKLLSGHAAVSTLETGVEDGGEEGANSAVIKKAAAVVVAENLMLKMRKKLYVKLEN